jgi:hypothetical protein
MALYACRLADLVDELHTGAKTFFHWLEQRRRLNSLIKFSHSWLLARRAAISK